MSTAGLAADSAPAMVGPRPRVEASEDPSRTAVRLTLEAALARAHDRSPLVRRAAGERRVAEAFRVGASLAFPSNPVVAASAGRRFDRSQSSPPAEGFEWGLHLEQAFEIGGQRGTRILEAERAANLARARERLSRVETRARVRAAYIGASLFRAHVAAAERREELAARVLSSARSRAGVGAASDVDVHLAESEGGRAAHDRMEAELLAGEAESELARLVDLPVTARIDLATPLGLPQDTEPLARLLEAAHRRREDLRALGATREQVDATLVRLRREIIPTPTLFGDLSQQRPEQTYVGGGIAIPVPVFRRNQGQIAVATAERTRIEEEMRIFEREIATEVARMHRGLSLRREEVRLWSEQVLPAAEANLALVTEGWQAGKFDLFRVVQVAREASEARRKQLEVLGALWQVAIDLDRATGAP